MAALGDEYTHLPKHSASFVMLFVSQLRSCPSCQWVSLFLLVSPVISPLSIQTPLVGRGWQTCTILLSYKSTSWVPTNSSVLFHNAGQQSPVNDFMICFSTRCSDEITGKRSNLWKHPLHLGKYLAVLFIEGTSFLSNFITLIFITGRLF